MPITTHVPTRHGHTPLQAPDFDLRRRRGGRIERRGIKRRGGATGRCARAGLQPGKPIRFQQQHAQRSKQHVARTTAHLRDRKSHNRTARGRPCSMQAPPDRTRRRQQHVARTTAHLRDRKTHHRTARGRPSSMQAQPDRTRRRQQHDRRTKGQADRTTQHRPNTNAEILSHDDCPTCFPHFQCIGHAFVSKNHGVGQGVKISRTPHPHLMDRSTHRRAVTAARVLHAPRSASSTLLGRLHTEGTAPRTVRPHAAKAASRVHRLTARGAGSSTTGELRDRQTAPRSTDRPHAANAEHCKDRQRTGATDRTDAAVPQQGRGRCQPLFRTSWV